ncbi:hypothetical protein CAL7716_104910 (plasmid) [Calothrix sp. PCC 7716]|nr:hypothetical protein CAL7716_104910 [Calothrix sp. PCC 7716]
MSKILHRYQHNFMQQAVHETLEEIMPVLIRLYAAAYEFKNLEYQENIELDAALSKTEELLKQLPFGIEGQFIGNGVSFGTAYRIISALNQRDYNRGIKIISSIPDSKVRNVASNIFYRMAHSAGLQ